MRSPTQESRDPNRAGTSAAKKRTSAGGVDASPARKQQRRKLSKKDRRRVSFAPDPELTLIHHFVKDDDYNSNSGGQGRVVVHYDDDETVAVAQQQRQQPDARHPALAADGGDGGTYRPGFWSRAVPENSPLSAGMPLGSPGTVSMELTAPTVPLPAAHVPGEVTAGLQSLGALAEADEWEAEEDEGGAAQQQRQQQQQQAPLLPGDVTAALPSLGALAEADEWEAGGSGTEAAGQAWAGEAAGRVADSITAALPGLADLVAEDEEATAAMDLTLPAGRVLEHHPQHQQQLPLASPQHAAAAASPAPAAASQAGPAAEGALAHPALAVSGESGQGDAAVEPTLAVAGGAAGGAAAARLSGGSEELVEGREVGAQLSKWGFAPGADDTMNLDLELHGRMIMGDQTFSRLYLDNTTGDGGSLRGGRPSLDGGSGASPSPPGGGLLGAAPSAGLDGRRASLDADPPHAPSPPQALGPVAATAVAAAPNWAAPAFLPPYMLAAPAASSGPADHPALAHSPGASGSSLNTLGTRRLSVDARRASVGSRRFSMQDATGRLLADDSDEQGDDRLAPPTHTGGVGEGSAHHPALPPPEAAAEGGRRGRRCSSGAAFLGRDVTEKLLQDESLQEDGEAEGPLADLKRQLRMLSQGSPMLAPLPEPERADASREAAAAAPPAAAPEAAGARTPRGPAASMGYADSHHPATLGLLRTGGTTWLLQETVQLGGPRAHNADEPAELGGGLLDGHDARRVSGGGTVGGDGTATRHGTTRLLADTTMASSVGADVLGSGAPYGTPELARVPGGGADLTDLSLGEFDHPPELPSGRKGQAAVAAVHEAADGGFASPLAAPEASAERAHGQPTAGDLFLGGPKLARTPVTARPASQPRPGSLHRSTPRSNARSTRSAPLQPTPASNAAHGLRGSHRLARTPASAAAAYPLDADMTVDSQIPGGPKLARTPLGRTPATQGRLAVPGSAVGQHHPGSARGVHFAAGPASASLGRYPGSAVALHRAGVMTPQLSQPLPMTFQDFTRLAEVQLLDNLRRGASINYADLQPNPVPQGLGEAYRLLALTSPHITMLESGCRILQEEVAARRVSAADAEALVGQANPAAFQRAQAADEEELEALRRHVGLLKRVCRQKAVYCLKDVRRQMEESRHARLLRNLDALRADLALAQDTRQQAEQLAAAAQQYVAEQHRRMAEEEAEVAGEAERRAALLGAHRAAAEQAATNEGRRLRLQEVQERVARLREEHAAVARDREALRGRTDALQMTLMQSRGQAGGLAADSSPLAIVKKLEELDVLRSCLGWQLEAAREDPVSGEASLRLGALFRLRLAVSRTHATLAAEALLPAQGGLPAERHQLLAELAGCALSGAGGNAAAEVQVAEPSGAKVSAMVQAAAWRLSRLADLAAELDGLRLACPALSDAACLPGGRLALSFINLDAEIKFGVTLHLPGSYPAGPVQAQPRVWFDGEGQITAQRIAEAVAAAPEAPGRLRAICQELSQLARRAVPRPALPQDAAFLSNWQNPLFGAQPAVSAQT